MNNIINRSWLLASSSILFFVMMIFSFSPIAWRLGGRRDQEYPELIFMFYGLPTSLLLLAAGGWIFFRGSKGFSTAWPDVPMFWVGIGIIFALGALTLLVLALPAHIVPTYMVQFALDNYLRIALPAEFIILIISCASTMRVK